MTPIRRACFTDDEWTLYLAPLVNEGRSFEARNSIRLDPCLDCPLAFAREMRAAGCCDGSPGLVLGSTGRPPGLAKRLATGVN